MEKQNPLAYNTNYLICIKIIENLIKSRSFTMIPTKTISSRYQISTFSYPKIQKDLEYIFAKNSAQDFSILIIENTEDCFPILREKWNFIYNPNDKSESSTPYHEISSALRSLAVLSTTTPLHSNLILTFQHNITCKYEFEWDSSIENKDIEIFPSDPLKFQNGYGKITIQVQYCANPSKPKILEKYLGARPRLVSFDITEDHTKPSSSFVSTEASPQDTSKINKKASTVSVIRSQSFINEIGVKFMSSDDCDSCEENFGHNSFETEIEDCVQSDEDSSISFYITQCKSVLNLNLFMPKYS
jgi:hypothetical protein